MGIARRECYSFGTPRALLFKARGPLSRECYSDATTPARKTGVGNNVLQIRNCASSDCFLSDCRAGELAVVEAGVESTLGEQFFVAALFDDRAVVHDEDVMGISDGREAAVSYTHLTLPTIYSV